MIRSHHNDICVCYRIRKSLNLKETLKNRLQSLQLSQVKTKQKVGRGETGKYLFVFLWPQVGVGETAALS